MIRLFLLFFLCCSQLYGFSGEIASRFDVVLVGTSPVSLLEALYQYHQGKSVLVLEQSAECGGVWKSREICGIPDADISCHIIEHDKSTRLFFEEYLGCCMVPVDHLDASRAQPKDSGRYYFSKGCHEMISHILELIKNTEIVLLLNHRVDSINVHSDEWVTVNSSNEQFETGKLIIPKHASFAVENQSSSPIDCNVHKYYHLYLLIEDSTPQRFIHQYSRDKEISRAMNLTSFTGLNGTGKQLIIVQTFKECHAVNGEIFLSLLKKKNLVDVNAKLLDAETCIYEQPKTNKALLEQAKATPNAVEILDTSYLHQMSKHIPRWKQVFALWK
ncbi:MAG: hypothetical protein WCF65_05565 [Parachlamydiaceae bacterium]